MHSGWFREIQHGLQKRVQHLKQLLRAGLVLFRQCVICQARADRTVLNTQGNMGAMPVHDHLVVGVSHPGKRRVQCAAQMAGCNRSVAEADAHVQARRGKECRFSVRLGNEAKPHFGQVRVVKQPGKQRIKRNGRLSLKQERCAHLHPGHLSLYWRTPGRRIRPDPMRGGARDT